MDVIICRDEKHVAQVAADKVMAAIEGKAKPVLGLATGSSPLGLYNELAARVEAGELDLSNGYGFALDEYVGIDPTHPLSYRKTITTTVVEPLKMNPDNVHVPNGYTDDLAKGAEQYEEMIKQAGGVDCQILGIGTNGHIGFNEPMSSLGSRTRVKTLTQQTRDDNSRFFDDPADVPTHCVTQGLGTIMESRAAVLVALGENKAKTVRDMVEGPVSAACPGSVLQFHPKAFIILDEAAASQLEYADYFRYVVENQPED